MGTAPYMSPEQVEGGTIDARSDIFSFGSVLYELLTGQRAFPGDSGRPPIAQILRDDPTPVSSLAPAIPADLASIVARCLRKDRARRYQNMADVKVALEDVRDALRSGPREHDRPMPDGGGVSPGRCYWAARSLPPVTSHGRMRLLMCHRRVRCR